MKLFCLKQRGQVHQAGLLIDAVRTLKHGTIPVGSLSEHGYIHIAKDFCDRFTQSGKPYLLDEADFTITLKGTQLVIPPRQESTSALLFLETDEQPIFTKRGEIPCNDFQRLFPASRDYCSCGCKLVDLSILTAGTRAGLPYKNPDKVNEYSKYHAIPGKHVCSEDALAEVLGLKGSYQNGVRYRGGIRGYSIVELELGTFIDCGNIQVRWDGTVINVQIINSQKVWCSA